MDVLQVRTKHVAAGRENARWSELSVLAWSRETKEKGEKWLRQRRNKVAAVVGVERRLFVVEKKRKRQRW